MSRVGMKVSCSFLFPSFYYSYKAIQPRTGHKKKKKRKVRSIIYLSTGRNAPWRDTCRTRTQVALYSQGVALASRGRSTDTTCTLVLSRLGRGVPGVCAVYPPTTPRFFFLGCFLLHSWWIQRKTHHHTLLFIHSSSSKLAFLCNETYCSLTIRILINIPGR